MGIESGGVEVKNSEADSPVTWCICDTAALAFTSVVVVGGKVTVR